MFFEQIRTVPPSFDAERARLFFDDLLKGAGADEALRPLCDMLRGGEGGNIRVRELLLALMGLSPFLRSLMLRRPKILQDCLLAPFEGHVDELCASLQSRMQQAQTLPEAMKLLRRFKQEAALCIALYDAAGVAPVERIVELITRAADSAVWQAVAFLFEKAARDGKLVADEAPENAAKQEGAACQKKDRKDEEPAARSGYFVLAMGKQGGFELNYSSDIDLIVFYDRERLNLAEGVEAGVFFVRLTRDLVRLLNERTPDGYVFRTDLRLRPDPGATQLAISTEAALVYYENYGQNWERAAMIKARVVAGDHEAGAEFLRHLAPYIWRKYLDFATINDIHAMKRQIHAHKGHGEIAVAGHNIKLGRGGIREIEFFVQTQQLIAGGRQPQLRGRRTLVNLQKLAQLGWISAEAAADMSAAYRFLRHVEHRLQMVNDEQTQTLPTDERELLRIARFCGFVTTEQFAAALRSHLENVQRHYAALFEQAPELTDGGTHGDLCFTGDEPDAATVENLGEMGFANPVGVIKIVQDWHRARYPAMRSSRAREALTELTPLLVEALAATSNPDAAFIAFDGFLKRLPAGVQLFSLLQAHPQLLHLLADIMGTAPRLANVLSRRPKLLDAVLDPGFFGALPDKEALRATFDRALAGGRDYSEILDLVRRTRREQAFLVGVRVLGGSIGASQAGAAYSNIAVSSISHIHKAARREIEAAHGSFSAGGSCVLAMGKLGGNEMTASSDLDLIIVYRHPEDESCSSLQAAGQGGAGLGAGSQETPDAPDTPEGRAIRPLMASQYFSRLTQRLITGLSAPTAEGLLYEVDMRLRPSGNAGPVATSLPAFERYQFESAWTWEHMALTRARVVSGPPGLQARINDIIDRVLRLPRDPAKIAADVVEMRERIFAQKGSNDIWELKQARGGLVDLEFTAQYLQLIHAHKHPDCLSRNTRTAFARLAKAGALAAGDAEFLINAAALLHSLTQILRLCYEKKFIAAAAPEGLRQLLARAADSPDFNHLSARLRETRQGVRERFDRLVETPPP